MVGSLARMELVVMAKEPLPGLVKTRLCPPFTHEQAAVLAAASLHDTLTAALNSAAEAVVLVLDGSPGDWCPPGVRITAQVQGSLGTRLEAAWRDMSGPALQVGMDTPQLSSALIDDCLASVASSNPSTALLGPATDGGWWALGMKQYVRGAFEGVTMSSPDTFEEQVRNLEQLGLRVDTAPTLTDVDTALDAAEVARDYPDTAFAKRLNQMSAL